MFDLIALWQAATRSGQENPVSQAKSKGSYHSCSSVNLIRNLVRQTEQQKLLRGIAVPLTRILDGLYNLHSWKLRSQETETLIGEWSVDSKDNRAVNSEIRVYRSLRANSDNKYQI